MWKTSHKMSVVTILASAVLPFIAVAADPPAGKPNGATYSTAPATTAWKASVGARQRDAGVSARDSALNIRVYEGFGTLGPVYGHRYPAYGIDVQARMESCHDGNTRISGLNIGGWDYQLSGSCADADQTAAPARPESDSITGTSSVIRCDPATWNCRTLPR